MAISGEDLAAYLLVRHKSCFIHRPIGVLLAQARPAMTNHHTSIPVTVLICQECCCILAQNMLSYQHLIFHSPFNLGISSDPSMYSPTFLHQYM